MNNIKLLCRAQLWNKKMRQFMIKNKNTSFIINCLLLSPSFCIRWLYDTDCIKSWYNVIKYTNWYFLINHRSKNTATHRGKCSVLIIWVNCSISLMHSELYLHSLCSKDITNKQFDIVLLNTLMITILKKHQKIRK